MTNPTSFSPKKTWDKVFRMKIVRINGRSEEPFNCPYCGHEIECHETDSNSVNWEVIDQLSWGEIDRMNCPYCHQRFELHQRC